LFNELPGRSLLNLHDCGQLIHANFTRPNYHSLRLNGCLSTRQALDRFCRQRWAGSGTEPQEIIYSDEANCRCKEYRLQIRR
jgi:hypothetical protein